MNKKRKRRTCKAGGCANHIKVKGLCLKHYDRLRANGTFDRKRQTREGVCSVEGCYREIHAKRLCTKHYNRKKKYGTIDREALSEPWKGKETKEQYFERNTKKNEETGCIEWVGFRDKDGYGFAGHEGKTWRAHRLYYHLFIEPIPEGKIICHHCDNPSCVNPDHLYIGTPKTNMQDKVRRGRSNTPAGEKSYLSKLTKEQAIEAIKRRKSGEKIIDIAEDYGVATGTIIVIVRGNNWKELDEYRKSIPNTAKLDKIGRISNSKRKLTDFQRQEIINRRKNGETFKNIKKDYSVSETALRNVYKKYESEQP